MHLIHTKFISKVVQKLTDNNSRVKGTSGTFGCTCECCEIMPNLVVARVETQDEGYELYSLLTLVTIFWFKKKHACYLCVTFCVFDLSLNLFYFPPKTKHQH